LILRGLRRDWRIKYILIPKNKENLSRSLKSILKAKSKVFLKLNFNKLKIKKPARPLAVY
jgi:hypothetical protein